VKLDRSGLWLGVVGASYAAWAFMACSSSSSNGVSEPKDATAQESSPSEEDAPSDVLVDAPVDTGTTWEAGAEGGRDGGSGDASDGSIRDGSGDASDGTAATCTQVDAGTPDDAAVAAGLAATMSFTPKCSTCHGNDFSGGTAVGGAISKNLTPDPATGLGCWTDAQIVSAILYGTTPDGTTLCVMPKWSTKGMTQDQAEEIVQYLRTLPAVSNQVSPSACETKTDGGETGDAGDAAADGG
jgi:mono/diheme cytochrome c family protein